MHFSVPSLGLDQRIEIEWENFKQTTKQSEWFENEKQNQFIDIMSHICTYILAYSSRNDTTMKVFHKSHGLEGPKAWITNERNGSK